MHQAVAGAQRADQHGQHVGQLTAEELGSLVLPEGEVEVGQYPTEQGKRDAGDGRPRDEPARCEAAEHQAKPHHHELADRHAAISRNQFALQFCAHGLAPQAVVDVVGDASTTLRFGRHRSERIRQPLFHFACPRQPTIDAGHDRHYGHDHYQRDQEYRTHHILLTAVSVSAKLGRPATTRLQSRGRPRRPTPGTAHRPW